MYGKQRSSSGAHCDKRFIIRLSWKRAAHGYIPLLMVDPHYTFG